MIPVNQFILGSSGPLLYPSEKTFWFKDVDFDGDKVWEYFHMNN
jgi:hypothetical protein